MENKICPRCKTNKLDPIEVMNALSRRASVYICSECGTDEALNDFLGGDEDLSWLKDAEND